MANEARNSFTSLQSYYADKEGEDITVGLTKGTVPSDEQAEELRKELAEALKQREILEHVRYPDYNVCHLSLDPSTSSTG